MKRLLLGLLSTSIFFSFSEAAPINKTKINKRQNLIAVLKTDSNFFLNEKFAQQNLIGEVTSIDPTAGKIVLKTADGTSVSISIGEKTLFRRVQPGQTSLANAEQITLADVKLGDRILVPGASANGQTPVRQVIVMAREAINAQRSQEAETRRARTTGGRITAINPETKEITVQSRGRDAANASTIVVAPAANAKYLRYAPDSLKLSDAVAGSFNDLRVGDQIRILGDRNSEGNRITAEEIFSGSITRAVGSIVDVNIAANQIVIKDSRTGQNLNVSLGKNTTLRRIPSEVAEALKQRINQREQRRRERNNQQTANNSSPQQNQTERQNRRENRNQNGNANSGQQGQRRDFQNPFENLPTVTIAELKKGDAVLITGTGGGNDNSKLTAVSIITGDADLQQILLRTQGGRNNSQRTTGLPGNVSGGNSVDDDEPRK